MSQQCWPLILIAFFIWVLQGSAIADTLTGRVIKITDGDTLTVLDASFTQHKIRLTGIDAPESDQVVRSSGPHQ